MGASLGAQLAGCVIIPIWTGIFSAIMFGIVKAAGLLRIPGEDEKVGIDAAEFSPKGAYKATF